MRQFTVRLASQTVLPGGHVAAEFAEPLPAAPAPGQFYLAQAATAPAGYLRRPLFPEPTEAGPWAFELPPAWAQLRPGDEIDLIGPCGRGREPAEGAPNVLLIAGADGPARLRPVARAALARHSAVVWLGASPQPLHGLPREVEVRFGLDGLPEALEWAEAVYADLPDLWLRDLQHRLRENALLRDRPRRSRALAFRLPPAPCGVGACGACAVATSRGWRLACVEGPWFEADELEW